MNPDGTYAITGIPSGTYHAIARGDSFDQAWSGIDCAEGCDNTAGTPIVLAQSQTASDIDFNPYPRYWIFGHVSEASARPVPGVAIDLWRSAMARTAASPRRMRPATTRSPILARARIRTSSRTDVPSPWVNQVYDGIPCPDGSAWLGLCNIDGGTDVPFPTSASFRIANFNLGPRVDPIFADGFEH